MDTSRSLGYTLHHLSFVLDRQSDVLLQEKFQIGFSQFKIMIALMWHEGVQQRDIAQFLGQTEASVSRQIKLLIDDGLVESKHDPANRRQHITMLTQKGTIVARQAMAALEAHYQPMFERLSEKQVQELTAILENMHQYTCAPGMPGSCANKHK